MEKGASWSGGECGIRMGAVFPKIEGAVSAPEATGGTLKITWKDCGDASTHAKVTGLQPNTITMGKTNTVTGSGTTDEAVRGAPSRSRQRQGSSRRTTAATSAKRRNSSCLLALARSNGMECLAPSPRVPRM